MIFILVYLISVISCFMAIKKMNKMNIFPQWKIDIGYAIFISIIPIANIFPILIYVREYSGRNDTPQEDFKLNKWFRGDK